MITKRAAAAGAALLVFLLTGSAPLCAQTTSSVAGRVTGSDGTRLQGARVSAIGTTRTVSTASDSLGRYRLEDLEAGSYRIEVVLIGFATRFIDVRLQPGVVREIGFALEPLALSMGTIEGFAGRAVDRRTPMAYSDVDKTEIAQSLLARPVPLLLNRMPSVYSTTQGGGANDARLTVRGFGQTNLAVLINGIPINLPDDSRVFWSDWDGLSDAVGSIQLQRGLSAANLPTPAVGGTLNIITDPAAVARRLSIKQDVGSGGLLKTTLAASSGLIAERFAVSAVAARKTADGVTDGTWQDQWSYYVAGALAFNSRNRIEASVINGPAKFGQRPLRQNVAAYSHEYARRLDGYDTAALALFPHPQGREYNQSFNYVTGYSAPQYLGRVVNRHDPAFINQAFVFFRNPLAQLNYFSQLTPNVLWSTAAYLNTPNGGSVTTMGSITTSRTNTPSPVADWDSTIARNRRNRDGSGRSRSLGILRAARAPLRTVGTISKLEVELSPNLTLELGGDWRHARVRRYRQVVDLLGGDYFLCSGTCASDFWDGARETGLGDVIDVDNTNTSDRLAGYAQVAHATDRRSVYLAAGISTTKYGTTNSFLRDPATGAPARLSSDHIPGMQLKAGGLLNISDALGVYANAGYVVRAPLFADVVDAVEAVLNENPKQEKFISLEAGVAYRKPGSPASIKGNIYHTTWRDRGATRRFFDENGQDYWVNMTGVNQRHMGVEVEGSWQPDPMLRLTASVSLARWRYTSDVLGTFRPPGADSISRYAFYIDGLAVGDAPQTQLTYSATVTPLERLGVTVSGRTYARHYADFNPITRTNSSDRAQSWQTPAYSVFDVNVGYEVAVRSAGKARLQIGVFNVFDSWYIQDAVDNSALNAFDRNHTADDAEVFLGQPRVFNLTISLTR